VRERVNLLVAVVVGLAVAAAGVLLLGHGATRYTAEARLVVLPAPADPAYEAVYYDTLSQGQVVLTMTEVMRGTVTDALGTTVTVRAITDTSVIAVAAEGDEAAVVEQAVKARLEAGLQTVDSLKLPFASTVLTDGTGTATEVAASKLSSYAVALGAGAFVGAVLWWLLTASRKRRT
jgi:hypothetical protein